MTTGRKNCIVWGSIHQKTRTSGGSAVHGYPDDMYFSNCNKELDVQGVPSADNLAKKS